MLISRPFRIACSIALLALAFGGLVALTLSKPQTYWSQSDAQVYRDTGRFVLARGGDLYAAEFSAARLPFTYPPIAAAVFAVFARLPFWIWQSGLALVGIGSLLVAARAAITLSCLRASIEKTLVIVAICLWLEPVDSTFFFGQINLVLMALVLADFALPNASRGKGVATGIAAAIKLTPLIFLPYLWFTGRRRAAVTGVATVLATIALGFAVLPASSRDYWSGQLGKPGDNPTRLVNQSLNGLIRRLVHNGHTAQLGWLIAAVILGCAGLTIAATAARHGQDLLGICVCAVTGLLISPISWTHHYVWVLPVLVLSLSLGSRAARVLAAGSVIVLFGWWPIPGGINGGFSGSGFSVAAAPTPSGLLRHVNHNNGAELHWDFTQTIAGNLYVWAGLVLLIGAARRASAAPASSVAAYEIESIPSRR